MNTDRPLPRLRGTLSRVIPSAAIRSANHEVQEIYDRDQVSCRASSGEVAPKSRKGKKKPRVYSPKEESRNR